MEWFADTWFMWLILTLVSLGLVFFNRQNRKIGTGFISSADEFSIRSVLLGVRKGEGDLFIGYTLATIFFSFFVTGFVRWVTTIL